MDKRRLFLWALYDFANSIIYITFVLYFAVWIVADAGLPDLWYNALFAIATLLLLATAPLLAARTDRHGGRKRFLTLATIGTLLGYGAAALMASGGANVWLVAAAFLAGQYFYQLSFVFFNPLLNEIADEAHRSRASGITQFASSLGFVAGIALTAPFAAVRTATLFPAVLAFMVLALPMILFYRESHPADKAPLDVMAKETSAWIGKMLRFLRSSIATPMLVAFFFFNDALLTVSNNYSIYLERVFQAPDATKSLLLALVLGMSALGALAGGWVGDRIGALSAMKWILASWILLLPLIALAPGIASMAVLTPLTGLLMGAIWTVTRSHLSAVLPPGDLAYGFSFYAIAERFATFVGPLTWGGIIWAGGTDSSVYRLAMLAMTTYIVAGLIILHRWRTGSARASIARRAS